VRLLRLALVVKNQHLCSLETRGLGEVSLVRLEALETGDREVCVCVCVCVRERERERERERGPWYGWRR